MVTEILQPITLDTETLKNLAVEIQSKFLDILNNANFPDILERFGQEPNAVSFNFRFNTSETPCSHAATDESEQLTPLQQAIQTKYLEVLNSANFPAILENFGQDPKILQFQFKLKLHISEVTPVTEVSVWNCLGCYCTCINPVTRQAYACPCT